MKLIPLILLIAVDVRSNEHFTFPPKFHPPNSRIMLSSDSSIYLPPESHTTIPYYPMKNVNLPYPYLPHTGTKAPVILPTPYPLILSTPLLPIDDDDAEEDRKQPPPFQKNNRTERGHPLPPSPPQMERRDLRPKPINYQPVDRIDMKVPMGFFSNKPMTQQGPPIQKATSRSMIISMDQQRSDALDQMKGAAAYPGPQFLPAPSIPGVYISSTTETAVPILRLSNEMDLDGSFSYEALGADQTHYVQHSRMENTGTDKEEQVVEGSYSYVGDNGQTYTVHYVADSKGFRASGDHLPVAPPIPEIIQRAVQYNLAEEAKKPPNSRSWNEDKENELSESERYHRYAIAPPPRPLFTGKTPESFSFGFAQGAHNTQNYLIPAANTQTSILSNNDFMQEQMKVNGNIGSNSGTISPQITFLASQGAHVPSPNTQQSISRVFSTERPSLPQLINYEAGGKESDQTESNKGLWRWQYGINANLNPTPEKNTISRSSGDGDDVMINFSDMTSDQYTKMIRSQLEPNIETPQDDQIVQSANVMNIYKEPNHSSKIQNILNAEPKQTIVSTMSNFVTQTPDWQNDKYDSYQQSNSQISNENFIPKQSSKLSTDIRAKLITHNNFIPQSQIITQSYDYEESSYEPRRISRSSTLAPSTSTITYNNVDNYELGTQNNFRSSANQIENIPVISTSEAEKASTTMRAIQYNDFLVNDEYKNEFRPIHPSQAEILTYSTTTTTETPVEDIFKNNLFLKNLFNSEKNDQYENNKIKEENKVYYPKVQSERKPDKTPKFIQVQAKPHNDIKGMQKKPLDIADIMNFISAKNHFESIKVKPQSKYSSNNYNHRNEIHFIPVQHDRENMEDNDDDGENMEHNQSNHRTSYYHPEELRGIIKNYKVLQRNNSAFNAGANFEQLSRDLSPPPVKSQSNLPPLGRAGPSVKSYLPPIYV